MRQRSPLHFASMNRLFFGDNLKRLADRKPLRAVCWLTAIFPHASVDLVYLDLPFNFSATQKLSDL